MGGPGSLDRGSPGGLWTASWVGGARHDLDSRPGVSGPRWTACMEEDLPSRRDSGGFSLRFQGMTGGPACQRESRAPAGG